jgi:hypothetical protein
VRRGILRPVSTLRVAIVTALFGHWLANALFDREQYTGAGPYILGRLDEPILVQGGLALIALTILTIRDRRRGAGSFLDGLGRARLVLLLVGIQLALFVGMEATERMAIEAIAGERTDVGVFGTGFLPEFVVAIGSALLLAMLGEATKRILDLLRDDEGAAPDPKVSTIALSSATSLEGVSFASGSRRPSSTSTRSRRTAGVNAHNASAGSSGRFSAGTRGHEGETRQVEQTAARLQKERPYH